MEQGNLVFSKQDSHEITGAARALGGDIQGIINHVLPVQGLGPCRSDLQSGEGGDMVSAYVTDADGNNIFIKKISSFN